MNQLDKALIQRGRDDMKKEVLEIIERYKRWCCNNEICGYEGVTEAVEELP